jgi:type II secretory pathway pseudopilin PulG
MKRRRTLGLSLIELLISMTMFGLLLGAVFLLFDVGSRGFRTVESRQGAQNQLAAVRAAVQTDLQVSHFYGIHLDTSNSLFIEGEEEPRHALSAVGLSDWSQRDQFGVPNWDQWVVYRVTHEPEGQLVRHLVSPRGGERGRQLLKPVSNLNQRARTVAPYEVAWGDPVLPNVLARGVRSLQARLDQEQRAVELALTIVQKTDERDPKPDVITATFYVKPHNTVPTD